MRKRIKIPFSVMRLTLTNKTIINNAPHIVMFVMLLPIAQQLAKLSWRIIFPVDSAAITINAAAVLPSPAAIRPDELAPFTLFGNAEKTPPPADGSADGKTLAEAPLSALKLRITGLLASSDAARSIAIVAKGNQQVSLGVGDSIPGNEAKIVAILNDRLIVNYRGRNEAIPLFDDAGAAVKSAPTPPAKEWIKQVRERPQNILNYLNISPIMVNEQLSGYRLNPGKDPTLFRQAGLQENDLAVALNGLDLRDRQQAQQALKQLPELSEITLTVERDGQRQDIYLALRDE
ncbi:type II secretion system protein GspC [Raoultella terrigena]|nr:type II secretion system protein GspC [Raoultella terrigena]